MFVVLPSYSRILYCIPILTYCTMKRSYFMYRILTKTHQFQTSFRSKFKIAKQTPVKI